MNPISYARMTSHLNKQEFARKMGTSRTYIIRLEQGCYTSPGEKLTRFASEALQIPMEEVNQRYERFQKEKRRETANRLNLMPISVSGRVTSSTPVGTKIKPVNFHEIFKNWRETYWHSIVNFSDQMCVHPSSVEKYENGALKSMPIILRRALEELNLLEDNFDPFKVWCYVIAENS
jgi:transcriptional regulator with XRE-family HTH domain